MKYIVLKTGSWEWTGIRVSTIKEQNNYMVKLEYLDHIGQASPKIQQPAQHLLIAFIHAIFSILIRLSS